MRKRAVILLAILIAIFGGSVNAQSFLGKLVERGACWFRQCGVIESGRFRVRKRDG